MGWGKDMLFLGGYLTPAVLAEEIEVERAARAADGARTTAERGRIAPPASLAPGAGGGVARLPGATPGPRA